MSGGIRVVMDGGIDAYMSAADETAAELLASNNGLVTALRHYDLFFRARLFGESHSEAIALILFMNAYQTFLAGVRIALSGHSTAVFPLLRAALESAAYGGLIAHDPELGSVWTGRHRDEAAKKACRKAFTFNRAVTPLKNRSPELHQLVVWGYEGSIDYGAHPNIRGVFGHVSMDEDREDGFTAVSHTGLYSASHIETARGLCACLDLGLAVIGIIGLSTATITEDIAAGLQQLSDLKNAATSEYGA